MTEMRDMIRIFNPVVNVNHFGTIGQGRDAKILREAIADVASRGGGDVILPGPLYEISEQVEIPSNVSMIGINRPVVRCTKPTPPIVGTSAEKTRAPVFCNVGFRQTTTRGLTSNIRIAGIRFEGPTMMSDGDFAVNREHYHCFGFSGTQGVLVERCEFSGYFGDAVMWEAAHHFGNEIIPNGFSTIRDNEFHNCLRGSVTLVSGQNFIITNNRMSGRTFALHFEPGASLLHRDLKNIVASENQIDSVRDFSFSPLWMAAASGQPGEGICNVEICNNQITNCSSSRADFLTLIGRGISFHHNQFDNCETLGDDFLMAVGRDIDIHKNQFNQCRSKLRFIRHRAYPSDPQYLARSGISYTSNLFQECTGGSVNNGPNTSAFFWPVTADEFVFESNRIYTGGYQYGLRCVFDEKPIVRNNILEAAFKVGSDPHAGTTAIYFKSVNTSTRGNRIRGWQQTSHPDTLPTQ